MATTQRLKATPSNAGLLALEGALAGWTEPQAALSLDDASVAAAPDLLAATDGIAIAFIEDLSPTGEAATRQRIEALLGPGWVLRDESVDLDGDRFRGVTALPPPEKTPPIGEAWALARSLAAVEGVQSATPLFAQVAPHPETREEAALRMGPTTKAQRTPSCDAPGITRR